MFSLVAIHAVVDPFDLAAGEERSVHVYCVDQGIATAAILGRGAFLPQCHALDGHELLTARITAVDPKPVVRQQLGRWTIAMLGAILGQQAIAARQAVVRTLGNLTLLNLSVNRQAQNRAFLEKRDLLIANTNLRLNIPLIARTTWDEAAIAERGKQLTEAAVNLWPGPRP